MTETFIIFVAAGFLVALVFAAIQLVEINQQLQMIYEEIKEFCKEPEVMAPVIQLYKDGQIGKVYHPASSCEVTIRDKATNHILARRHIEDPETISAMDDPLKIVDFGPSDV